MGDDPVETVPRLELPVAGLDCADCEGLLEAAVRGVPGVRDVEVPVSAGRVAVTFDPARAPAEAIRAAVAGTGFAVAEAAASEAARRDVGEVLGWGALGLVALVVLVAALGERLGLFDAALERLPPGGCRRWPSSWAAGASSGACCERPSAAGSRATRS